MIEKLPQPKEIWTDEYIDCEDHIGEVKIVLALGPFVSYIKKDGTMGVMEKKDFVRWFSKKIEDDN